MALGDVRRADYGENLLGAGFGHRVQGVPPNWLVKSWSTECQRDVLAVTKIAIDGAGWLEFLVSLARKGPPRAQRWLISSAVVGGWVGFGRR